MNIDDFADKQTNQDSPGDKFHDGWLTGLPENQWPSYIDESAQLVADGIFIGETELTKSDFASETGKYYRSGLAKSADVDPKTTALPLGNYSAGDVGSIAWTFNRLREQLRKSKHTDFENPSRAIEAAINKELVERVETDNIESGDLETIRLPESATVSTIVSEVFCRPRSETYIDLLLDTVSNSATSGLLSQIEQPRMVTPLWKHQRKALDAWLTNDCRGYVDMATATGKTFLGLAAIAHHFGELHPEDRDLTEDQVLSNLDGRGTVVVIAHRELILEQWKREFDTHLNIPEQSTTTQGEHTAHFEWGDVHFWTPSRLQNADVLQENIDLAVLDETHHYLGSSGFGSILDHLDGDVLALSGSLDDTNARTLERRNIPKLFEFTLSDGQEAGVVPRCDWDVVLTPYDNQAQLAEVTERGRQGMEKYESGISVPDHIDSESDEVAMETLSEARSFAQSTIGRELKESNEEFREFSSAVMARQLTKYNLSPNLSTVVHLALDHIDQHKCVVLLETTDEIEQVTDRLKNQLGDAYESLITVLDDADLTTVEEFDSEQDNGAIIGVAQTLGEGIDIETADICINRGRGRLSRSLIQRMGRILRNPTGDKHAKFYHVAGVPTREDALLPAEDGIAFLETASQLLDWGDSFEARPVFDIDDETPLRAEDIEDLERAGADAIDTRSPEQYEPPSDEGVRNMLETLRNRIADTDGSALLAIERLERESAVTDDGKSRPSPDGPPDSTDNESIQFVAADNSQIEIVSWLYELVEATSDDVDIFVEDAARSYAQTSLSFPTASIPDTTETRTVELNPALDAVLSAYAGSESKTAAVHAAIGERLVEADDGARDEEDQHTATEDVIQRLENILEESNE